MESASLDLRSAEGVAEIRHEPLEMFCKDFDLGCFDIEDPRSCKAGLRVLIGDAIYYTVPVILVCPLADRLRPL